MSNEKQREVRVYLWRNEETQLLDSGATLHGACDAAFDAGLLLEEDIVVGATCEAAVKPGLSARDGSQVELVCGNRDVQKKVTTAFIRVASAQDGTINVREVTHKEVIDTFVGSSAKLSKVAEALGQQGTPELVRKYISEELKKMQRWTNWMATLGTPSEGEPAGGEEKLSVDGAWRVLESFVSSSFMIGQAVEAVLSKMSVNEANLESFRLMAGIIVMRAPKLCSDLPAKNKLRWMSLIVDGAAETTGASPIPLMVSANVTLANVVQGLETHFGLNDGTCLRRTKLGSGDDVLDENTVNIKLSVVGASAGLDHSALWMHPRQRVPSFEVIRGALQPLAPSGAEESERVEVKLGEELVAVLLLDDASDASAQKDLSLREGWACEAALLAGRCEAADRLTATTTEDDGVVLNLGRDATDWKPKSEHMSKQGIYKVSRVVARARGMEYEEGKGSATELAYFVGTANSGSAFGVRIAEGVSELSGEEVAALLWLDGVDLSERSCLRFCRGSSTPSTWSVLRPTDSIELKNAPKLLLQSGVTDRRDKDQGWVNKFARQLEEVARFEQSRLLSREAQVLSEDDVTMICKDIENSHGQTVAGRVQAFLYSYTDAEWPRLGRRGMLFYGPPGTGKSELCNFIKRQLLPSGGNVLVHCTAADLNSRYIGETEAKIREIVQPASLARNELFLVILEEIDTIAADPDKKAGGGQEHKRDVLTVLLDAVSGSPNVIFVGTTNHKNKMDERILRSKRLGEHILVGSPPSARRAAYWNKVLLELNGSSRSNDALRDQLVMLSRSFTYSQLEAAFCTIKAFRQNTSNLPGGDWARHSFSDEEVAFTAAILAARTASHTRTLANGFWVYLHDGLLRTTGKEELLQSRVKLVKAARDESVRVLGSGGVVTIEDVKKIQNEAKEELKKVDDGIASASEALKAALTEAAAAQEKATTAEEEAENALKNFNDVQKHAGWLDKMAKKQDENVKRARNATDSAGKKLGKAKNDADAAKERVPAGADEDVDFGKSSVFTPPTSGLVGAAVGAVGGAGAGAAIGSVAAAAGTAVMSPGVIAVGAAAVVANGIVGMSMVLKPDTKFGEIKDQVKKVEKAKAAQRDSNFKSSLVNTYEAAKASATLWETMAMQSAELFTGISGPVKEKADKAQAALEKAKDASKKAENELQKCLGSQLEARDKLKVLQPQKEAALTKIAQSEDIIAYQARLELAEKGDKILLSAPALTAGLVTQLMDSMGEQFYFITGRVRLLAQTGLAEIDFYRDGDVTRLDTQTVILDRTDPEMIAHFINALALLTNVDFMAWITDETREAHPKQEFAHYMRDVMEQARQQAKTRITGAKTVVVGASMVVVEADAVAGLVPFSNTTTLQDSEGTSDSTSKTKTKNSSATNSTNWTRNSSINSSNTSSESVTKTETSGTTSSRADSASSSEAAASSISTSLSCSLFQGPSVSVSTSTSLTRTSGRTSTQTEGSSSSSSAALGTTSGVTSGTGMSEGSGGAEQETKGISLASGSTVCRSTNKSYGSSVTHQVQFPTEFSAVLAASASVNRRFRQQDPIFVLMYRTTEPSAVVEAVAERLASTLPPVAEEVIFEW